MNFLITFDEKDTLLISLENERDRFVDMMRTLSTTDNFFHQERLDFLLSYYAVKIENIELLIMRLESIR